MKKIYALAIIVAVLVVIAGASLLGVSNKHHNLVGAAAAIAIILALGGVGLWRRQVRR